MHCGREADMEGAKQGNQLVHTIRSNGCRSYKHVGIRRSNYIESQFIILKLL